MSLTCCVARDRSARLYSELSSLMSFGAAVLSVHPPGKTFARGQGLIGIRQGRRPDPDFM
jgi:hypothetical protein